MLWLYQCTVSGKITHLDSKIEINDLYTLVQVNSTKYIKEYINRKFVSVAKLNAILSLKLRVENTIALKATYLSSQTLKIFVKPRTMANTFYYFMWRIKGQRHQISLYIWKNTKQNKWHPLLLNCHTCTCTITLHHYCQHLLVVWVYKITLKKEMVNKSSNLGCTNTSSLFKYISPFPIKIKCVK